MSKSRPRDPRGPTGRAVSSDESDLWRQMTGDVAPIKRPARPAGGSNGAPVTQPAPAPAKRPKHRPAAVPPVAAPVRALEPALEHGAAPGLDKRTRLRLKRGQVEPEAVIDLHGLTQAQAHRALSAFLHASREAGRRQVLVVTGKGTLTGQGVLKDAVPRWLNEPAIRPMIRAFAHAPARLGGEGALTVLLKRRR